MRKSDWSGVILGFLMTTAAACRPVTEDDPIQDTVATRLAATVSSTVVSTTIAQQPTTTSENRTRPTDTPLPPAQPTPEPTMSASFSPAGNWQQIGNEATGLEIAVPLDWVDLSGRIDVSAATSKMGLIVLLMADSEKSGSSLLAGKELSTGAFAAGLISNLELPTDDPIEALMQAIESLELEISTINEHTPLTISLSSPGDELEGAYVDVSGDPAGFFTSGKETLRTRILMFPDEEENETLAGDTQAIFLLSAAVPDWEQYADTFAQMIKTIVIYDVNAGFSIHDGAASVLGNLEVTNPVNGRLDSGIPFLLILVINTPCTVKQYFNIMIT